MSFLRDHVLTDAKLAAHATGALPVWLWRADGTQIVWANAVGAAIFGGETVRDIEGRHFNPDQLAASQIAQVASTLAYGRTARLERLRGFGAGYGRTLTCQCTRFAINSGDGQVTPAILVVAIEPAGPALTRTERLQRLLAGEKEPFAVFSTTGELLIANESGRARLDDRDRLDDLRLGELAATAMQKGSAHGMSASGDVTLARIGPENSADLLIVFAPVAAAEQNGAASEDASPVVESDSARLEDSERLDDSERLNSERLDEKARDDIAPVRLHERRAADRSAPEPQEQPPVAEATATETETVTDSEHKKDEDKKDDENAERRHPLRFIWQTDAQGRFSLGSDEFTEVIGPGVAVALGRPWSEIAEALQLDPDHKIADALATHETWSNVEIAWPVEGSDERLPVTLSGLPVFDRDRTFTGYRGFGICRDLKRIARLRARRLTLAAVPAAPQEREEKPAITETPAPAPEVFAAARQAESRPTLSLVPQAENVVRFPSLDNRTTTLSPVEKSAFAELAARLSERLNGQAPARTNEETSTLAHEPRTPHATGAEEEAAETAPARETPPVKEKTKNDERLLLDRLPVGVLIYRHDHFIYANRAFLAWTGHDDLNAFADAGGLDSLFIEQSKDSAGENAQEQSLLIETPRGDRKPTGARLLTIPWEDATAMALVLSGVENQSAQAANAENETRELRSILDTATDGIILLDAEGKILSSNPSAQALFGRDEADLEAKTFTTLFAPESAHVAQLYLQSLVSGSAADLLNGGREVIGLVQPRGMIPLFMTLGRIAEDGQKFCAVFRDITAWKKTEEELVRARRQAEKASSAKSDFIAKISHEIRTPLNAIIGFSEVMMDERFGTIGNERYRDYLKDIHHSGQHLLSLLNDLLDLSKIEAGKFDLHFASVDLNEITQQAVAIMQPQANRQRIIIRTSLPAPLPRVTADARTIRQIVLNLLSNSIKFTAAGGQVIVSTALNDEGDVILRVRDTGIGMSEKEIAAALEPFRSAGAKPESRRAQPHDDASALEGTGIGLPLTKALAEANRARFSIKSAVNSGTLVEILFPATRVLAAE